MKCNENIGCAISIAIYAALSVLFMFLMESAGGIVLGLLAACAITYFISEAAEHYVKNKNAYEGLIKNEYYEKEIELIKKIEARTKVFEDREKKLLELLTDKAPFNISSLMYADVQTYVFERNRIYLETKPRPARTSAETVKLMREEAREHARLFREMEYKFYILLDVFPELKPYIDDATGEALSSLKGSELDDVVANYDKVRDYISDEEYRKLSNIERNQLALDRYNARPKSNWTIGVEYEMYIEYYFQKEKGYKTIPHGSLKGLNDLGRDIIAEENKNGNRYIYIVQCKRYAAGKQIHENTICQLYGTAIEYELSHSSLFQKVVPILYSTVDCSPMAKNFANKLGVLTYVVPMGKYPQIKCNISSTGEKIYHLPFDQQYYNTLIDRPGEFMAITVEEAEKAGFRRARKHIY